ncbi:MAG: response regulator [Burkholderiales bacterium]|jgi:DNA-binding response OmpR family regulator
MLSASQLTGLRVLVVDDLREMRAMLRNTLADAQIRDVVMVSDARAAVDAIRAAPFNLILADYDLGMGTDGQQLLEYLRRERLMPPGGLYFLISADSTIDKVASAAEMLPDGYLVKPVNTDQMLSRIEDALVRQAELRPMYGAVHQQRWEDGLVHCARLEPAQARYRMEVLRHAAICQVALGRWDDALVTYRTAHGVRATLTWPRLGIARCCLAMGDLDAARQRLQSILEERPYHAGAYDVLIELLERTGALEDALAVATRAAQHIPSAIRTRRQADLAYLVDDLEVADEALTKVVRHTQRALTRDFAHRALLSQVCLARGDAQRAIKLVEKDAEDRPDDVKVQALATAVQVQAYTALGCKAEAGDAAKSLEGMLDAPLDPRSRLLVAKAALTAGMVEPGLRVLDEAVQAAERASSAESASVRTLATKVLTDAGMADRAATYAGDRTAVALRKAEGAVKTLRGGGFDAAVAAVGEALTLAPEHTGVLSAAVEVYLMTMRVQGVRPELLAQVHDALARLRARGTVEEKRLAMLDAYLDRLEGGSGSGGGGEAAAVSRDAAVAGAAATRAAEPVVRGDGARA